MAKSADQAPTTSSTSPWTAKRIVGIVIGVVALIFVFSNTAEVTLRWLWWSITAPAWLMLMLLLIAGVAVGFLLGRSRYKS